MKSTALSVEQGLDSALKSFKEQASAVKKDHDTARKAIKEDVKTSDLGKKEKLEALRQQTSSKLAALKSEQQDYIKGLRDKVERELRGDQPADASAVLLRRDAADRTRKLTDKREAMELLNDAIANGDQTLAHALGTRARATGMFDVAEAYKAAFPGTADSAEALAHIEGLSGDMAFNVSNSMTFSPPSD